MKNRKRSKFMSVILTLTMVVSLIPAVIQPAKALAESTSLAGTGVPEDPFLIQTADDLTYMRTQVNSGGDIACTDGSGENATTPAASASYRLTADIVLNDNASDYESWGMTAPANTWTPIGIYVDGTYDELFTGTFDGGIYDTDGSLSGCHTISGIYINHSDADYQGLFGYVGRGGTIINLGVEDSYISGGILVGGVVGLNYEGTIQNCYSTGIVSGSLFIGGIVGANIGVVQNCYNIGSVSGDTEIGGVIGRNYSGIVRNCYNTGSVSGGSSVGGVTGLNGYGTIQSCYNTGLITGSGIFLGGVIGVNVGGGLVQHCYYDQQMCTVGGIDGTDINGSTEGRLTLEMVGETLKTGDSGEGWTTDHWTFTPGLYPRLTGMSSTDAAYVSASPIFLRNDSDTASLVNSTGFTVGGMENGVSWVSSSSTVVLHSDHVYILDAQSVTMTATRGGMSKTVTLNTTPKLKVVDTAAEYGFSDNPLAVKYPSDLAYVAYQVDSSGDIAYTDSSGDETTAAASASYRQTADIAIGYWQDTDIDGTVDNGEIYEDNAFSTVCSSSNWTPIGIFHYAFCGAYDGGSYAISGIYINKPYQNYQGLFGCVGLGGTIKNVGVTDDYIVGLDCVSGVVATIDDDVQNCYHTGSVSGRTAVGGVVGSNYGDVQNCYNTGRVSGSDVTVGGVIGGIAGNVQYCYNTGTVIGGSDVGGVVGHLVRSESILQYCYSTGTVGGSSSVGGVVGYNNLATVQYSYSSGTVSGDSNVGGVVGENNNTVQNCYYDKQMCSYDGVGSTSSSTGAEGRLTSAMTGAALQDDSNWATTNWIFTTDLYPRLTGMSSTDAAYVSASPVFLTAAENTAAVKTDFTLSTENGVTWESSDGDIVGIGTNGRDATANSAGSAALTASLNGISKTIQLTVLLPYISPTTSAFDKYSGSADCKDISVNLTLNGNTLSGIYNGTDLLTENTDYTVSGSTVVLPVSYLKRLPTESSTLTFQFNVGPDQTLSIAMSDSTPYDDAIAYRLTFETGGGSEIRSFNCAEGTAIDLSGYTPTRDGYIFTGWYADTGLTEKVTSVRLTGNIAVYAGWTWENPFTDVSDNDWYYEHVEYVYQNGLMNGTGSDTFHPNGAMSRAMFATILYRLSGDRGRYTNIFSDVPSDAWYESASAWAAAYGIASGGGDGRFLPDGNITREQLAVMLWRYAKYQGYDVSIGEDTNILSYSDAFDISDYAYPALQWACGAGIISGDDSGSLNPQGFATRAEAAAILRRFIEMTIS